MNDSRLLGTWISDRRRTIGHLERNRPLPPEKRKALEKIFGRLRLRYTPTRCYATLNGDTDALPYRVLAKNSEGTVLMGRSLPESLAPEEQIQHLRFVSDDLYWVCLGGIHEFFRRVKAPSNKRMQLTRSALANSRRGPRS